MTDLEVVLAPDLIARLPLPGWSRLTEPYWTNAAEGRLVVQRCDQCGTDRWEPFDVCYNCRSWDYTWTAVPGTGHVYTYTWADERGRQFGIEPYNLSVVELHGTQGEPIRLLSWIEGIARTDLTVGLEVEVCFASLTSQVAVPHFRPRA